MVEVGQVLGKLGGVWYKPWAQQLGCRRVGCSMGDLLRCIVGQVCDRWGEVCGRLVLIGGTQVLGGGGTQVLVGDTNVLICIALVLVCGTQGHRTYTVVLDVWNWGSLLEQGMLGSRRKVSGGRRRNPKHCRGKVGAEANPS